MTVPANTRPARSVWMQAPFMVVVAVLLLAAGGLNFTTQYLQLHFKKEAVPQPKEFATLPRVMGSWVQVSDDEKLDKEIQDVLGTDHYIYRDYVDASFAAGFIACLDYPVDSQKPHENDKAREEKWSQLSRDLAGATLQQHIDAILAAMKDKSLPDKKQAMNELRIASPNAVVNMGLTYYTGLVDTVAHIPDRCYIADGYEPSSHTEPTWQLGDAGSLQVRFMSFEDKTGSARVAKNVTYVFHCNGKYQCDPLAVRGALQSLTERYGYYAKIELMTIGDDHDLAAAAMSSFMAAAKPSIETCLPNWKQVTGH